jgi:cobalt/nickel transport protein
VKVKMKNPLVAVGLVLSLVLAGGASFYASSQPDGLEKVAGDIGFLDSAEESAVEDSPLSGYGVAGVDNERISGGLAGVIGVASTAAISFGLFYALRRFKKDQP